MSAMTCQECGMPVPSVNTYHPHLHCVLWKAYHRDPAKLLAEHGYERVSDRVPL